MSFMGVVSNTDGDDDHAYAEQHRSGAHLAPATVGACSVGSADGWTTTDDDDD